MKQPLTPAPGKWIPVVLLAGLVAACCFQYTIPGLTPGTAPYWTLGITFGGFHIVYGTIVWIRHGG